MLVGFAGNRHAGRRPAVVLPPLKHRLSYIIAAALIRLNHFSKTAPPWPYEVCLNDDASFVKRIKPIPSVYLHLVSHRGAYYHSCPLLLPASVLACICPNIPAPFSEQIHMPPLYKVLHFKSNCLRARQVQHLVPRHNCTTTHVLGTLGI